MAEQEHRRRQDRITSIYAIVRRQTGTERRSVFDLEVCLYKRAGEVGVWMAKEGCNQDVSNFQGCRLEEKEVGDVSSRVRLLKCL